MNALPSSAPVPKIPHSRVWTLVLGGCAGIAGLFGFLFLTGARSEDGLNYYVPKGYVRQVKGMLDLPASKEYPGGQKGPVRHEGFGGDAANPLPGWGRMFFDESMATPRQAEFFQLSGRLRQDMDLFNETGEGFFRQQPDSTIWVTPYQHKFALPYPERKKFRGIISMGEEAKPSIVGENLILGFDAVPETKVPLMVKPVTLRFQQWALGRKNLRHDPASAYDLCDETGVPLVRFSGTKDSVKLQLIDSAQIRLYLNGDQINVSGAKAALAFLARKDDNPKDNAAPLMDGDRLRIHFNKEDREIALRYGRYSGSLASRSWIEDGKQLTLVDPELARLIPYVADLHAALNRYVEAHPDPSQIGQPSIRLTFDRDLHAAISDVFLPYVRRFDATRSPFRNIALEPASVCVMNALNGDVLAMPSYPAPADVENLRKRLQSRSITGLSEAKLKRLALNQNLALTPIGSTTKPLFAACIWDLYPNLRHLVVTENGSSRQQIFDYRLRSSFNTVPRGDVSPENFLRVSSNDYTAHLGLLMLAGPQVQLSRDGKHVAPNDHLDLSNILKGDVILGGLARPDLPVFPKLHDCFDAGIEPSFQAGVADGWVASPLGKVFKDLHADGELLYRCFSDVLPQRTNLRLDRVNSVRGSFLSMLLGSGSNYWSNVMLTQAYCRLGTGKMVNARFAMDAKGSDKTVDAAELPLGKEALGMVQRGMRSAAQGDEGSTARAISPAIREAQQKFAKRGLKLVAMCKTGTASRVPALKDAANRVIEPARECAAYCLYMEVRDAKDAVLAALTSSVYLQDRGVTLGGGSPRNSGVAVDLTKDYLPALVHWLEAQPAVVSVK